MAQSCPASVEGTNGPDIEMIEKNPFMLSWSKHVSGFFSSLLRDFEG